MKYKKSFSFKQGYYELQHIGGPSAKITQEADNVLVIQRRREVDDRRKFRKFLYVSNQRRKTSFLV